MLQNELLEDMLQLLQWCIHKKNECLARTGTECLHILILSNGTNFTERSWKLTCDCLKYLFESTAPVELMKFDSPAAVEMAAVAAAGLEGPDTVTGTADEGKGEGDINREVATDAQAAAAGEAESAVAVTRPTSDNQKAAQQRLFASIIIKCVVQLELIKTVEWIVLSSTQPEHRNVTSQVDTSDSAAPVESAREKRGQAEVAALAISVDKAGEMFECLTADRLTLLLDCLLSSHKFAQDFNANKAVRVTLWKAGFMKNRSKPNLLKQATSSLGCALRIMFRIYEAPERSGMAGNIDTRISDVCATTLQHYVDIARDAREIWSPLISLIFREFLVRYFELFGL